MTVDAGVPTFHTRVESWECDFNGHWNTRFYAQAFQSAASVCASMNGDSEARDAAKARHCRFHSEMASGDAVEVRSFNLADPAGAQGLAHYMFSDGKVVATAFDPGAEYNNRLTDLALADASQALPRGLTGPASKPWPVERARHFAVELGPVRKSELGADGVLQFDGCVARLSVATQHHVAGIGFSHDYTKRAGIGRMLVEMRFTRLGPCAPGECLVAASRLVSAQDKAFVAAHLLYTHAGQPIAMFDLCTLSVDLSTRRAVAIPDFLKALATG